MGFQSFEDLLVWQRGKQLALNIYRELKTCRDFCLRDQMQRAAISIPSNIAEGYERTPKDFARFISISIGSCSELRTQLYIAEELEFLPADIAATLIDETKQLNRMMRALARAQHDKTTEARETTAQYNIDSEPSI